MRNDRDNPPLAGIALPRPARTQTHLNAHTNHESMGDDAYLRYPSGLPSGDHNDAHTDADTASQRTTSTAALQATRSRKLVSGREKGKVRRGAKLEDTDSQGLGPAAPIGLLAAIGTPYAKKAIWRSKKFKVLCPLLGIPVVVVTLVIIIFPVLRAVAKHILSVAVLSVSTANITYATNESFVLTLEGQAKKVAIFPATLYFERPVRVYWIAPENLTQELFLEEMALEPIGVANGHGRIKQKTVFNILDQDGFGRFTEFLITQEEFTWRLKSEHVQAKAFSFLAVNGLTMVKDLTLKGVANTTDVAITDFQIPGDDPAGGISIAVSTRLTNPSAFGVEIGILEVGLYYQDLYLGPARTASPFNLTAGVNHVNLVGRIVDDYKDDPVALAQLSTVFSMYLNGDSVPVSARGISATLPSGETPSWLQRGIKALILNVPLASPTGRISPITGITIESLSLAMTPENPYSPMTNTSHASGTFALPFGFSLDIVQLSNSFTIVSNRTGVASLGAPLASSSTTILSQTAGGTSGSLTLEVPLSPLVVPPSYEDHLAFDQFVYDLALTDGSAFTLIGNTSAVTNTPMGQVKLTNIGFTLPSGLIGLSGLTTFPTNILSVDVVGGTPDAVILNLTVGLTNPSNLDLTVGDVTFQLFNGDSFLGTTVLPSLHLKIGYQEISAIGYFQANDNPVALATLTDFAEGRSNVLSISGFNGSTDVKSLTQAFMAIKLSTTLAGLTSKLVNYANLTVLPTTGHGNNIADGVVSLQNPFSSDLVITNIQSNVSSHGLFVGSIVVDTDFKAAGNGASNSPPLAFNLNLYPPEIFSLVRALVVEAGLDPVYLDGVIELGGLTYVPTTSGAPVAKRSIKIDQDDQELADLLVSPAKSAMNPGADYLEHMFMSEDLEVPASKDTALHLQPRSVISKRSIYTGFDLPSYIIKAFSILKVEVDLVAVLHIGDFVTNLAYRQTEVPAYTDSTLVMLLPVLALPIVQRVVDGAFLTVDTAMISNPSDTSFTAALVGSITNAGPFDGIITFPAGLTVAWNGRPLGQIAMPAVTLVADTGAALNLEAAVSIADLSHVTEFAAYLLNEPSFTWQIYGENLTVNALGIEISGISISKDVVLQGFNGLKGLVRVESFDLPANDPAGGVTLSLQTSIQNPSQVGVALSTIGFGVTFGSTYVGPAASTAPFVLAPRSTVQLALGGRLVEQTSDQGLADLSTIFNGFVHGVPSELLVTGTAAGPADCSWLNTAIKTLSIGVILPAAENLEIITAITIEQATFLFSEADPWNPRFSTNNTVGVFQLPFALPVDITAISTSIVAGDPGSGSRAAKRDAGDFALVQVPLGPAKTDVVARTLIIAFEDVPFGSTDNGIFSAFLKDATLDSSKSFTLRGSADTQATTGVGSIFLQDIPFAVSTSILGVQGLNARPVTVSDVDVFRGFSSYIQINANAALFNPSNLTIGAGDVTLDVIFQGEKIGVAIIPDLLLRPNENLLATEVRYQPTGGASTVAGQQLLANYVQGVLSDLVIAGSSSTTPIASLQAALGAVAVKASLPALTENLVTAAVLTFPTDIAVSKVASAAVVLANPFTASVNLLAVASVANYRGIELGNIDTSLNPPISAAGKTTITSRVIPFNLNADPKVLINFFLTAAKEKGVDIGFLVPLFSYILALDDTTTPVTSTVNLAPETCTPSGSTARAFALIIAATTGLQVDLTIDASLKIDEYQTSLSFAQNGVNAILDRTVLYLAGIIGAPVVNNIVEQATLSFSSGLVTNVTDQGFTAMLNGALLGAGPLDALIEFPEGVTVIWDGHKIATVDLPPLCSQGDVGIPNLVTTALLTITDQTQFTAFATFILLNPSFEWTLTTDKVRVTALGAIFDNVSLTKVVSFSAFNGLPGITINSPNFPGDDGDSIILQANSVIPSPANLGIELGRVSFVASFDGQEVGPIAGSGLVLPPLASTSIDLEGRIVKRTSQASTDSLAKLFSQFLAGDNSTLTVVGNEVITPAQPDSPVKWLSTAFKKLSVSAILPGQTFDIIKSIKLEDLELSIVNQAQAYAPQAKNNLTNVVFQNPFGFSLRALAAGGTFVIEHNNVDAISLTLPSAPVLSSGVSTGQEASFALAANIQLNFQQPQTLQSLNNGAFESFFAAVTNTAGVEFGLHGSADVVAQLVIGVIPINGIPFAVTSTFPGINNFNRQATIPTTPVVIGSGSGDPFNPSAGGSEYIRITLQTLLSNPAPVILHTNMVALKIIYQGAFIGRALVNPFDLYPGANMFPTELQYAPDNPADPIAQGVLTAYLSTNGPIPITVQGDLASSPYGGLGPALAGVTIPATFPGQGIPLFNDVVIYLDPITSLCPGTVEITARVNNNLGTSISVISLSGKAFQGGVQYAEFTYVFPEPFVAPPGVTSPYTNKIGPVKLSAGVVNSLPLLFKTGEGIDIEIVANARVDGYNVPALVYAQKAVPYAIQFGFAGQSLSADSLTNLLQNPAGGLAGLLGEINAATNCVGGALELIEGQAGLLAGLPKALTGAIGGLDDALAQGAAAATAVLPPAIASIVTSGAADFTSAVGVATSVVEGIVGGIVGAPTAAAGSAAGAATPPAAAGAEPTSAGGALGLGIGGLRKREQRAEDNALSDEQMQAVMGRYGREFDLAL